MVALHFSESLLFVPKPCPEKKSYKRVCAYLCLVSFFSELLVSWCFGCVFFFFFSFPALQKRDGFLALTRKHFWLALS